MKVYIEPNPLYSGKIMWFLELVRKTRNIAVEYVPIKVDAEYSFGYGDFDININAPFFDKLSLEMFDASFHFEDDPWIKYQDGTKDHISTIFYLVNGIQEYNADASLRDNFGRFMKEKSIQEKFGITQVNYAIKLLDEFLLQHNMPQGDKKSSVVTISHDIDFLTSGFRQEVIHSIRHFNFASSARFLIQKLRGQSPWNNIEDIAILDQNAGISSTFYWLNYDEVGKNGIPNADYTLSEKDLDIVNQYGHINGLHKSAKNYSFRKEVGDFPQKVIHNRNHFLNNRWPYDWKEMERNGIKTDSSMAFSRGLGFRNSFGLPFYPYNLDLELSYKTLIVPTTIMDVALNSYGSGDRHAVVKEIMDFINDNPTDTIISILFHNNNLTPFSNKYLLQAYQDIIDILQEEKIPTLSIDEISNLYR